jgi:hypothetical protein
MRRALAILLVLSATAHANGRPPAPIALHFSPASDSDLYLQVTFGILESHDAGATWRWTCEDAIGYNGVYDPDYAISASGALFATSSGLEVRRDGCSFGQTSLGPTQVSQVATDAPGATIYAAASDVGRNDHNVYVSIDDGVSWNPVSTGLGGAEVAWSGLEVAPSNPQILYLAGYDSAGAAAFTDTFYKSIDAGAHWTPISTASFTMTPMSQILVSAVSPDDPDFLFVSVTHPLNAGVGTAVWRSVDGGASWTLAKQFIDNVGGVVIRKYAGPPAQAKTSAEVVLGTVASGMWVSEDGGQTFTEHTKSPADGGNAIETRCMIEHAGILWACGNNLPPDAMALGKSPTPDSWLKVLQFKDIAGTIACGPTTMEEQTCNLMRWCGLRDQIGIIPNPTSCVSLGADGPPIDAPVPPHTPPKGCCDGGGGPGATIASVLVIGALLKRRRRAL